MARIRTIKPQHVNDKRLTEISLQAHLFWVLSWCFSDDEGVIENDPFLLKSQIFPRRQDIRVEQINQWIDQLIKARFVIPFTYNGEGYLLHRTFNVHQKIDRPQPSKIPDELLTTIRRTLDECSTNDQPCIVKDSIVKEEDVKGEDSPKHTQEEIEMFKKVKQWIEEKAPSVNRMKEPLTITQYLTLKNQFSKEMIAKVLLDMHNWKPLTTKRTSAYRTFLRFAEKDDQNKAA